MNPLDWDEIKEKINIHLEDNYQFKDRSHFFEVLARKYFENIET